MRAMSVRADLGRARKDLGEGRRFGCEIADHKRPDINAPPQGRIQRHGDSAVAHRDDVYRLYVSDQSTKVAVSKKFTLPINTDFNSPSIKFKARGETLKYNK